MAIGKVTVGTASSLRINSEDAGAVAKAEVEKATQEAEQTQIRVGQIKYSIVGQPVFNCLSNEFNRKIKFSGGSYIVDIKQPFADDLVKTLDHFVTTGMLTREEGKAE